MGLDTIAPLYDRAGPIASFGGLMAWNGFNILIPNFAVRLFLRAGSSRRQRPKVPESN